jgi:phage gp36-like protein
VQDAADEIDSYLGSLYTTPLVFDDQNAAHRPWMLLLKRLNAHLATGRLLMSAASGNQDKQVHAYAEYLIKAAESILKQIQTGEIVIPFQTPPAGQPVHTTTPLINNLDEESNVEAFYDRVAKPSLIQIPREINL